MFAAVVAASIVDPPRLIEALLRFYYKDGRGPRRVVATSFAALFWFSTAAALLALPFAGRSPKRCSTDAGAADLARIAIGGLWVADPAEYLLTLFRLEERARAFFLVTIANVLAAIALTVVLVVGREEGARGLLLGSYASGAVFVLGLIVVHRRRLSLWVRPPAAAPHAPLRPADDAGRALALRAQLRRPDHHRPLARARRGGPLLARGQVRPGGQRARPRLPARLAAARLLDPRRRRGAPRLRRGRHLVRRRLRLRRHRHVAVLPLDRARPGGAGVLRLLRSGRPDRRPASPSTPSTWSWS